jgi:hypothetical protein
MKEKTTIFTDWSYLYSKLLGKSGKELVRLGLVESLDSLNRQLFEETENEPDFYKLQIIEKNLIVLVRFFNQHQLSEYIDDLNLILARTNHWKRN